MQDKLKQVFNYFLIGSLAVIPIVIILNILLFIKTIISDIVHFVYAYSDNAIYTSLFFILSFVVLIFIGHKLVTEGRVWFLALFESIIERIPLLSTVYRVIKKIVNMFSTHEKEFSKEIVYVEYPKDGIWVPAYVVNRYEDQLVLFIPTSPNPTSGFAVIVHKDKTRPSKLTIEEASSFIVSVGVDFNKIEEIKDLK